MESPSQAVYASIHGQSPAGQRAVCWLCGGDHAPTRPLRGWLLESFNATPHVRAPHSDRVCEACVFLCSRTSPVPGREAKPGKLFGGNWRNYSHMGDAGTLLNASKGEKPAIREFLCREKIGPWFCAVAESGQKHVLPLARINPGAGVAGWVLFEETPVRWGRAAVSMLDDATALLTLGVTKAEVESGAYWPRTWEAYGAEVRAFESKHRPMRGGRLFDLVLFLAQRGEQEVDGG